MILPNGVTGFYSAKHKKPPTIDEKQFKKNCFSLISSIDGEILEFKGQQISTNFFDVEAKISNKHMHILLNVHYPFMAFASKVECGEILFINESELDKLFSPFYNVLEIKELNEPVILRLGSKQSILQKENDFNNDELKQIAYWKPKTIGDIIFNYWD